MSIEKRGGYEAKLSPDQEKRRQEIRAYQAGWIKGSPETARVTDYIISSIDQSVLKDVLTEYLKKSGVPAEHANTEALDRFFSRPLETSAAYLAFTNSMALSTESSDFDLFYRYLQDGQPVPPQLLREMQLALIHEACHAFSRVRVDGTSGDLRVESGYVLSKSLDEASSQTADHIALNEGVTQRIAEEVFLEYGKRIGTGATVTDFIRERVAREADNLWVYSIFGNQVDFMCDRISAYAGVPKETVWEAFKRGYFENPELLDSDVIELFRETFGESFLEAYKKLDSRTPLKDLGSFDGAHQVPHPGQYAKKWLAMLGIRQGAD